LKSVVIINMRFVWGR